jgi:hypothetical protein
MEPRNIVVRADAVPPAEGNTDVLEREDAQGPGTEVSPGSESRACARGISRNLGGPVASLVADCGRGRGTAERGNEVRRGRAAGSRSAAVVPRTQGNQVEGPCRGKGGTGAGNRWRERWGDTVLRSHLTGNPADSMTIGNPCSEEPDAVVPHVRICGGPGAVGRGYPTPTVRAASLCSAARPAAHRQHVRLGGDDLWA